MPRLLSLLLLILLVASVVGLPLANASILNGTMWEQAGQEYGLDPILLYSVTIRESGRQVGGEGRIKPWPYAIGVNGYNLSIYPKSRQEAEKILAYLISQGITNVDIGLGQVNLHYHAHRVRHWSELLDPQTNLRVAAAILKEALDSTADPVRGVGHYHSWTDWRAVAYGRQVLGLYRRLLAYAGTQPPWGTLPVLPAAVQPPLTQPILLFKHLVAPLWPAAQRYEFQLAPIRRIGGKNG